MQQIRNRNLNVLNIITNEKDNNKKRRNILLKILWIVYAIFSIVVWLPTFDTMLTSNYEQAAECLHLNESWNVQINDKTYEDVSLNDFHFEAVDKGDQIILEGQLPDSLLFDDGVLRMNLKHSALRIFIDEEMVYEYGFDRIAKKKSVGSGKIFIDFPGEYAGKNIRMEFQVDEHSAFTSFDDFNVYSWKNIIQIHLTENRIPMFFGIFLFVLGLVAGIVTILAVLLSPRYIRLVLLSSFSICMGLWTLCFYDIFTVFTIPLYSIALIEYMVLYLAPIFIIGYMHDVAKKTENKYLIIAYWLLLIVLYLFISTAIALHYFDIIHCAETLPILLSLVVVSLIYLLMLLVYNFIKTKTANIQTKLYFIGILNLVVGIAFDIGSYSIKRYIGIQLPTIRGASQLAIIIFVVILIYVFFLDITDKLMHEKEREFLIQRAYYDELTGLHNRRYCAEHMEKMEESTLTSTAVICFDVNNLKMVNDTLGHLMGDLLISDAANVINKTFGDYGVVGRMGGDEFIAIIKIDGIDELTDLLKTFHTNVRKNNKSTKNSPVSIAVGAAFGKEELVENVEKLYQIADERMYDNKKEMNRLSES